MKEPGHPPLAVDRVRFLGDALAVVLAETKDAAKDGAEAVAVDYEVTRAVVSAVDALKKDAPLVHDDVPGNLCYDWELATRPRWMRPSPRPPMSPSFRWSISAWCPTPIEPRSALAEYDRTSDSYTLYTSSQNPHVIRLLMCAFVLHLPEHKVRVVAPDVAAVSARRFSITPKKPWSPGRPRSRASDQMDLGPVRSFPDRRAGPRSRSEAALALDKDGKFLALRVATIANMGAYLSTSPRRCRPISMAHCSLANTRRRRSMWR